MDDHATKSLTIAHQLSRSHAAMLAGALPPDIAWRHLPPDRAWVLPEDAEILIAVPPRGGVIAVPAAPPPGWPGGLRWLHAISAGVDEFPKWIFDVPAVTCGRGTNSEQIAEFTLAAMLTVAKQMPDIWISDAADWRPRTLGTLAGRTLGLLGFGSIGHAIARLALPFGMTVLAHRRSDHGLGEGGVRFVGLDAVLAAADHLVIALPLTPATTGLIGRAALARVKPGVHLINIARGKILDHVALLAALEAERVGFATLDVTEPEPLPAGHPLYRHRRARISPHICWSGGEVGGAAALLLANYLHFRAGRPLLNRVRKEIGY